MDQEEGGTNQTIISKDVSELRQIPKPSVGKSYRKLSDYIEPTTTLLSRLFWFAQSLAWRTLIFLVRGLNLDSIDIHNVPALHSLCIYSFMYLFA